MMTKATEAADKLSAPARPPLTGDNPDEIARYVAVVGKLAVVPKLLQVLCDASGMRFAAVACVTDTTWAACAVHDGIQFGLVPGGQLDVKTTLCSESRALNAPIFIDHASDDPRYRGHPTPKMYKIESYVSVPIVLPSGRYFGNLCAIDPAPAHVSDPKTSALFEGLAQVIALEIHNELEREKDQTALRDANAAAELREQFIAILGHDLRNPLQAVYATSDLLERRLTDTVLVSMAARIKVNVRRMSRLIDDVLDFARGRLGSGIGVQIKPVADLESALMSVVEELQDSQPDRKILLDMDLSGPVNCDEGRLQQALSNLVGNALTHGASQSPIKVMVSMPDNHLVMEVWNRGEPIPAESLHKIFDPFWRHTTSADRQGLGLGLHICSQIVRAHGGVLSVSSNATDGTCFKARIPQPPVDP